MSAFGISQCFLGFAGCICFGHYIGSMEESNNDWVRVKMADGTQYDTVEQRDNAEERHLLNIFPEEVSISKKVV